jgi:Flp pilus assembly pilin Flp
MKARQITVYGLIAVIITLLVCAACDTGGGGKPEPVEEPKNQSTTIDGLFDNNASATVKGYLTDSEWNGVPDKIKTALNAQFEETGDGIKEVFRSVYTTRDVIIILEINPSYANYSAVRLGDTVRINYGIRNNTDALKLALQNVTRVMSGNPSIPEQG